MENNTRFIQLAMKTYDNPHCTSVKGFRDDLRQFSVINRQLNTYEKNGSINIQAMVNSVITCRNLFGVATYELFKLRVVPRQLNTIMTFLLYLDLIPVEELDNYKYDTEIIKELKKI